MAKFKRTLTNECVAFTGRAWRARSEIARVVRRLGGSISSRYEVTEKTTILVRGSCAVWKYGDHGRKERHAAELLRHGRDIALIHDSEFRKLVEHQVPARISDHFVGQPTEWLVGSTEREFRRSAAIAGPLDREHTTRGRVEQAFLRHDLLGDVEEAECCICGRRLPPSLLVAAHIKPRSECLRRERLDVRNIAFTVCLLGCDALYERGLISVRTGGKLRVSRISGNSGLRDVLETLTKRKCSAWAASKARYFDWHLNNRFQG